MAKWWLVATLSASFASVVLGACPNKCSGHGKCGLNDVCDCMQNWIGGDCSGRQCPFTRAWHDTAQRDDDAHYYAECANRGSCDRSTGECACDAGFVGSGCRRMQCPNDCSGHGTCEFIEELAGDNFHKRIQGVSGRKYSLWDQEKIMGCVCDANYEGHDCSLRTCPKGDDPLTPNQFDMVQAIVITAAGGSGFLTYYDPYGNAYTTEKITFGAALGTNDDTTCSNIQQALRRLPNNVLNTVTVEVAARVYGFTRKDPRGVSGEGTTTKIFNDDNTGTLPYDGTGTQDKVICEVQFTSEAGTTGFQNLLDCNVLAHNDAGGQHPMSAGITGADATTCKVYEVYPVDVVVTDLNTDGSVLDEQIADGTTVYRPLTELAECSGRGACDYSTGTCECFAGHMGLACQKQEALV
ncbi:hypothetical protein PHYSODRAFT_549865 [Phytophthora sojae]|uniref:EGF-like domain-containing protein n=1 Tax=Phytophthora sojae (strain P6497) TaxID=1094619 RepID=G5A7C4_PHYSP|nr:hypothetical protein PHYSODRAFT_549865 [Phytophthora sojae]EGZ09229.1 hypothetical protein PHYSODRAFT_549865 [Phytophthora sojae]|eukprot:XP_009535862.1 hypothetical protein PHYSODRAFT_549865 [Phytophthora sojae]